MNRKERRRQRKKAGKPAKNETHGQAANRTPDQQTLSMQQSLDLALKHHNEGDLSKAGGIYQQILQSDPNQPDALHLLGVIAHQTGKNDVSVDLITQALAIKPDFAEAHYNLGTSLQDLGRLGDAVESYQKAITVKPDYAKAHNNLGNVLKALGKLDDAVDNYHKALAVEPNYADAHSNLGNTLKELGKLDEAVVSYQKALAIKPDFAGAHINLGNTFTKQGRLDEAVASFHKALAIKPDLADAHNNLGAALQKLGRPDDAVNSCNKALAIKPDFAEAHSNLGAALKELGRLDEAVASCNKALAIKPDFVEGHNNLGLAFQELERMDEAIACHEKALQIEPDDATAHWSLTCPVLMTGNFARGWECYEWRWKANSLEMIWRDHPHPIWDGSPLNGKRILIWGEQGMGDEIVFASLYAELINRGARCIFECEPRLVDLLQRSFPVAVVVGRSDPPAPQTLESDIDFHCPAGDLMKWLMASFDDGPSRENYLIADTDMVTTLKSRYRADNKQKVVGLGWWTKHLKLNRQYNIPIEFFDSLLKTPGVQFVNLQYGDHGDEIDAIKTRTGVTILQDREIDPLENMDAFAAQEASMDLVISNVNSTAALASGLGIPVWGLLPKHSDWRWGNDNDRCLWYPSMRLFRQSNRGDWSGVFQEITSAFQQWVKNE